MNDIALNLQEGSQVASLLTMICLIVLFCCTIRTVSNSQYIRICTFNYTLHHTAYMP